MLAHAAYSSTFWIGSCMTTPRPSLMRKRASRLAAVQAMYSESLIERTTLPGLLANQLLASWADSRTNNTDDLPTPRSRKSRF